MGNQQSVRRGHGKKNIPKEKDKSGHVRESERGGHDNKKIPNEQDESEHVGDLEPGQRKITVCIVGAGMRGQVYATYARDFPNRMQVIGVAEPIKHRREMIRTLYKIDERYVFDDWKGAANIEKFADAVIIGTLDHLHKDPCIAFANKGYHILLEKPIAPTLEECEEIINVCKQNKIIFAVGHVLRYKLHFLKVKEILESGRIGEIVSIQHIEQVGWNHFAHSYVRGNWRRTEDSGFSLLTKCCHDIDLINSFMGKSKCLSVSSFGSLNLFKRSEKPEGAGDRCTDCSIEETCPYSAKKIYLEPTKMGYPNFFCHVVAEPLTVQNIEDQLKTGPYGRCVYECDNDVISNQVVNMIFEGGKTVSMSMVAFTEKLCVRQTKIFGTKGELQCSEDSPITVFDFATQTRKRVSVRSFPEESTRMSDHDYHLMTSFVKAVALNDPTRILSGADETLESHRLVFLAEQARLENRVITLHSES